jgi:hypothetical protein
MWEICSVFQWGFDPGGCDSCPSLCALTQEPPSDAYVSKFRQLVSTVTGHHLTTTDLSRSKFDHTVTRTGPTFEGLILV